jgi:hypothetical protein
LVLLCPVLHLLLHGWHRHEHTDHTAHQPQSPKEVPHAR